QLDRLYRFLSLVSLASVVLGGIGIASAIHQHVSRRLRSIAILRCLGATAADAFGIYLIQAVALGLLGCAGGVVLGVAIQASIPALLANVTPLEISFRVSPLAIAVASGLSLIICVSFALFPLLNVRHVPPLAAIRAALLNTGPNRRDRWTWIIGGGLVLIIIGFGIWQQGMDYERGLRMLKELLETGSAGSKLEFPGEEAMPAQDYVGLRSAASIAEMGEAMEYDMKKLHDWVAANEVELAGTPFTIYHQWNPTKATTEYTLGFPLGKPLDSLPDGFVAGERPACRAFPIKHTGSYCHLGNAWSSGINRARNKVFRQSKTIAPFEIYENSPAEVPEEELETTVYFPLRD
ncbi:FtsX-like permease family protein, partial [Verrucomicrobiales bacterium]|nr:FtsX-like permease family protein [Verrucomicrobiales bacterium]